MGQVKPPPLEPLVPQAVTAAVPPKDFHPVALAIAEDEDDAWRSNHTTHAQNAVNPVPQFLLGVELLEGIPMREDSIATRPRPQPACFVRQPRRHEENAAAKIPSSPQCIAPLLCVLDHVHNVAEVNHIGVPRHDAGPMDWIPAGALNPST